MDTNVRKFKYSPLCKFLCVMLSIIMAASSVAAAIAVLEVFDYRSTDVTDSFVQSQSFLDLLRNDINDATGSTAAPYIKYEIESSIADVKKEARSTIYAQAEEYYNECVKNYNSKKTFYSKDIRYSANTEYGLLEYNFDFISLFDSYDISYYYDDANGEAIISDIPHWDKAYIENEIDERCYTVEDDFVSEYASSSDYLQPSEKSGFIYQAVYKGKSADGAVAENTNNFDSEKLKQHTVYYMYNGDGKEATYTGLTEAFANELIDYINTKNTAICFYIDLPEADSITLNDVMFEMKGNKYIEALDSYTTQKSFSNNLSLLCFVSIISLAICVASAVIYLSTAGKKQADGYTKLAFIDYVPVEIHTAVTAGLIALLVIVFEQIMIEFSSSEICIRIKILISAGLVVLGAALLIELVASFVRSAKSDRKKCKFFLVYYLGILFKKLFKSLSKLFKKIGESAKKFGYKPNSFAKNIVVLTLAYLFGNIICVILITLYGFTFLEYPDIFAVLFFIILLLAYIAVNAVVIKKVVRYFSLLDTIITKTARREELNLDVESLPLSLKTLVGALDYTNAELNAAVEKAIKDERLKTELITNVSHDLKTPLTSIITYVDLLSNRDINDGKAREYISVLGDKSAKLKRLIDDLIEASKVTSGNITIHPAPLNLVELSLQATVEAQPDFESAELDLIVKENDLPVNIFADGQKTYRIIENLLSNARKYSAKGTRVYVDVYTLDDSGVFEIKNISDQPLDISPDELTQRFVRGDKSRSKEGNGLGLSIATELCRIQGGKLTITIDGDLFKARVELPKSN